MLDRIPFAGFTEMRVVQGIRESFFFAGGSISNMRNLRFLAIPLVLVIWMSASPVRAIDPFFPAFLQHYRSTPLMPLAVKAQCQICHYGEDDERNDYGLKLSELGASEKAFRERREDRAKLNAWFKELFEKAEEGESSSGVTFGELIEQGRLPGTPPKSPPAP